MGLARAVEGSKLDVQEDPVQSNPSRNLVPMALAALALALLGACGSSKKDRGSGDLAVTVAHDHVFHDEAVVADLGHARRGGP